MTFSYTARTSNGSIKRGTLRAETRAEAIALLKAQGDIPLEIIEGSSTSASAGFDLQSLIQKYRTPLLAVVALGVAVVGVTFLLRRSPSSTSTTEPLQATTSSTITPTVTGTRPPDTSPLQTTRTPPSNTQGTSETTRQPTSTAATSPGSDIITDEDDIQKEPVKRPYPTITEQLIAMLGRPGEQMPPLPLVDGLISKDDFTRAMEHVIEISDKDDERSADQKTIVAWVKLHMSEVTNDEWTPEQYLRELEHFRKEQALERRIATEILADVENENPAEAERARQELNAELEAKGILKIEQH